jgi:hypothetical protein
MAVLLSSKLSAYKGIVLRDAVIVRGMNKACVVTNTHHPRIRL